MFRVYRCGTTIIEVVRRQRVKKHTGLQLVKKFPAFHGSRRFITALTRVRQLSLSWASPIQSIYPHPTSWGSSLVLSTHLCLGLPSGLLPSGFPTKTVYTIRKHLGSHNALKYRRLLDLFSQTAWRWPNKRRNMSSWQYTLSFAYEIKCYVIDWHVVFISYTVFGIFPSLPPICSLDALL